MRRYTGMDGIDHRVASIDAIKAAEQLIGQAEDAWADGDRDSELMDFCHSQADLLLKVANAHAVLWTGRA